MLSPCAFSQALAVIIETGASKGMFSPNLTQIKVDIHMPHRGACHLATLADSRTPNHPSSVSSDPGRFCGGGDTERERADRPPTEIKRARTTLLSRDNLAQCLCRRTFLCLHDVFYAKVFCMLQKCCKRHCGPPPLPSIPSGLPVGLMKLARLPAYVTGVPCRSLLRNEHIVVKHNYT